MVRRTAGRQCDPWAKQTATGRLDGKNATAYNCSDQLELHRIIQSSCSRNGIRALGNGLQPFGISNLRWNCRACVKVAGLVLSVRSAMKIVGTGVDLVEVSRIAASIERFGERFVRRVFTAEEIRYCRSKHNFAERFAARFAAKEAGLKAIGTGWRGGVAWVEVEV